MKGKKIFCIALLSALVTTLLLLWPVFPAYADDNCPEGCYPNPAPNGMRCQNGCWAYNRDGSTRCCDAISEISGGDCFIATASGQSDQNLSELYWFRDHILVRNMAGRGILFLYYDLGVGRALAPIVQKSPWWARTIRTSTSAAASIIARLH